MKRRVKTDPAPVQPAATPIEDIHHEVIPVTGNGVAAEIPIEDRIRQEIVKFNLSDQKIAELKAKYGTLKVAGLEDKEGYTTAKLAWQLVRSKRTALEKKGLELREDYNAMNKAIRAEELRLIGMLKPLEDYLANEWRWVENKLEEIRQAEIRKAEEQFQARVEELMALPGATLEGEGWTIGETVSVDVATLRQMTEERYQKFLTVARKQAELIRIQKEKEEAARLAEEQERENQRQEFLRQQKELAEQKAAFEQQQQDMQQMIRVARTMQLELIGMTLRGDKFIYSDELNRLEIMAGVAFAMKAEQWNEYLASATANIKKMKEEQAMLKERKTRISQAMAAAGMLYDYHAEAFYFKNDFLNFTIKMDQLLERSESALETIFEEFGKDVAEAKQRQLNADEKRQREEQLAADALLSDQERFYKYVKKLVNIPLPNIATPTYQAKLEEITGYFDNLLTEHNPNTTT